jgi:ubiquinone/menaquinone biosynthesis C-methylase UbiE
MRGREADLAIRKMDRFDLDHDSLRIAKVDRTYDLEEIVNLTLGDSHDLPFSKEKFDIAILAWSL